MNDIIGDDNIINETDAIQSAAADGNTASGELDADGSDTDGAAITDADMAAPESEDTSDASADPDASAAHAERQYPHREVLSFVRRSARLDRRLKKAWDNYADAYLLNLVEREGQLDVRDDLAFDADFVRRTWGNDHPLIVEIGTGQGENIAAAATAHPELNFLALEVYEPGVAHTLLLAGKNGASNLRIAQVNAPSLFAHISDGLLAEVWTFFPDPWPKKKHHKRRIVQPALAAQVRRCLRDGGAWRIATDIDDYALHVHEVMDAAPGFRNAGTLTRSLATEHVGKGNASDADAMPHADFPESERFDGRVLTNFERKGLDAGRTIHDFTYVTR